MTDQPKDPSRRKWMYVSCAVGAVGAGFTAVPFVKSMQPSERAKAAGAPVEFDASILKSGEKRIVEWRGKPVWVLRRTPEMLESLNGTEEQLADPDSERNPDMLTPAYARNSHRSIKPELLVAVGICSHLGCSPVDRLTPGAQPSLPDDWSGGFFCPCHGSTFDVAGRVHKNKPAPDNLEIPPHRYIGDSDQLVIGEDASA